MNRSVLVLGIVALFAWPARAQDSSIEEAKAHAARAKVHYDLGEYEKAAEEYILVYRIKPLPALLYNIAQSYRQAGQYEKARQFYKSYLREAKDAPNRDAIEKAIREIDELLAKEKKAKDGPPKGVAQTPAVSGSGAPAGLTPPLPAVSAGAAQPASTSTGSAASATSVDAARATIGGSPPPRVPAPLGATTSTTMRPAKSRTLFWVTAGASAAALAAGGIFGLKTLNSRSTSDAGKANLFYGIGGGLAVVSGALLVFDL